MKKVLKWFDFLDKRDFFSLESSSEAVAEGVEIVDKNDEEE